MNILMKKIFFTHQIKSSFLGWAVALLLPFIVGQSAFGQYTRTVCNDPYIRAFAQTGTTFVGTGDDAVFNITLPFTFQYWGVNYTNVKASTNGFLVFPQTGTTRALTNTAIPTATTIIGAAMYPFWDDLDGNAATSPNSGIYTRTDGVAPNRIFSIEWNEIGHFGDVAG
ncbi:MAG TPA: hypothetical protein PKC40_06855, partial [Saprospiraceae bacterium]|nr:hypothetical protein [Saprospiraceae bacterium]